jgi:hypothetical protein
MSASAPLLLCRPRENIQRLFRILIVNADAAFDRDWDRHGGFHRRHALTDERGLRHQAGAEAAVLHPVRRATDIEINLFETRIGADASAGGKITRIAAAKLKCNRVFGRIVPQQPRPVAVQHRAGRQHLGVKERAARQQTMEEPAMPVGPFHHRSDAEYARTSQHFNLLNPGPMKQP